MKFSVVSSDVKDWYSFFLPAIVRAWARMGYGTVLLLIGDRALWNSDRRTALALREASEGAIVEFVAPSPGQAIYTSAQVSRLYASALQSLENGDYLLTSDADMIPLSKEYFSRQDPAFDVHIFSSNAYAAVDGPRLPVKFPMCYLGASVPAWREIMRIGPGDVGAAMASHLAQFKGHQIGWDHDEMHFKRRLLQSPLFSGPLLVLPNGFSKGRVQLMTRHRVRGHMDKRLAYGEWSLLHLRHHIDCHFGKGGPKYAESLLKVFETYFPEDEPRVRKYISEYTGATP